jgi:hypothetical protein
VSAIVDMDDPLAGTPPPPRDTPPSPHDPAEQGQPPKEPRKRVRNRGKTAADTQLKLDLKEIESKLSDLLQIPAVPMAAAGDVWPAQHIEARSPALAKAIAHTCKENIQLREKLLQLLRVGDGASLLIAALTYAAPVAMYYGIVPAPPILKAQLQVPDRARVRQASMMEQMRQYEREEKMARDTEFTAATGEPVPSEDAQAYDPENPRHTPPPPGEAQTSPPQTL